MGVFDGLVKRVRGEVAKRAAAAALSRVAEAVERAVERAGEDLGFAETEPDPASLEREERAERVRKTQETANRRLAEREAKGAKKR